MAQAVECSLGQCKALSSNFSTTKIKEAVRAIAGDWVETRSVVTSLLSLPAFHARLAGPPPAQPFSHMSVKQAVSRGYSGPPVHSVLTALLYLPHSPRYLNPQAHFSSLL
jgi:hypothetical protein